MVQTLSMKIRSLAPGDSIGRGTVMAVLLVLLGLSACARLGLAIEQETGTQDTTVESLRSAVRDGQRIATDLRVELADQRKELAEVHVARAQLQGVLRDTERRLTEARQIIELQREELEAARVARERVEESDRRLHSRLRRLEKLLAQARRRGETSDIIPSRYVPSAGERAQLLRPSPTGLSASPRPSTSDETAVRKSGPGFGEGRQEGGESRIIVQERDTLWRLAQRHHVDVEALRRINGLQDDRIVTGWTLRLPAVDPEGGVELPGAGRSTREAP
jgi:LysM repeat protein